MPHPWRYIRKSYGRTLSKNLYRQVEPMVNRRYFTQKIVAAVPAMTTLVSPRAHAQQTARPGPPPGRGPMDGSPLGDPLPGQKWRVHDRTRPQPRRVTPGQPVPAPSAPSDAVVLFDGRDLSKW